MVALMALVGCRSAQRDPDVARAGIDGLHPATRCADYTQAPLILVGDLLALNLWYLDTILVNNRRLTDVVPTLSRSYAFLETAQLAC